MFGNNNSGIGAGFKNNKNCILDQIYGVVVAYSLMKIKKTATKCLRVRRSSDNAELDVGFINNNIDINSLLNFVGTGNGYVSKWYDQSGNNNDLIQLVAASQPLIINGGLLITNNNGEYIVDFPEKYLITNSSLNGLTYSNTGVSSYTKVDITQDVTSFGERLFSCNNTTNGFGINSNTPNKIQINYNNTFNLLISYTKNATTRLYSEWITNVLSQTTSKLWQNNTLVGQQSNATSMGLVTQKLALCAYTDGTYKLSSKIHSLIIFDKLLSLYERNLIHQAM